MVTVSVKIAEAPQHVWLERLDSVNAQEGAQIGTLSGGNGAYMTQVRFNENAASTIFLQVVAEFPVAGAEFSTRTSRSGVFFVQVTPPARGGSTTGSSSRSRGQIVADFIAEWWRVPRRQPVK